MQSLNSVCYVDVVMYGLWICTAVKVVRDSSSGRFVKISDTRVVRTTTVSLINVSAIAVRHVATSAAFRLA